MIKKFLHKLIHGTPRFLSDTKYKIVEAFECGGITYYQFENPFNVPYQRGLSALDHYDVLRSRCDKEYLVSYSKAVKEIITDKKLLDLRKLMQITSHLEERVNMIVVPDHVYNLASVVYFDATENPAVYDYTYGQKKVQRWKKEETMKDFFLRKPITELIPYLQDSEGNIPMFSDLMTTAEEKMRLYQQAIVTSILSKTKLTQEQVKSLLSSGGSPQ